MLIAAVAGVACNDGRADTPQATAPKSAFAVESEAHLRSTLATASIEAVMKGSGGRSLAFKLSFANGVQGYFKPEQTFAAHWNSELAAYYLDRELGLGRALPAIGRKIPWEQLRLYAAEDPR